MRIVGARWLLRQGPKPTDNPRAVLIGGLGLSCKVVASRYDSDCRSWASIQLTLLLAADGEQNNSTKVCA